MQIAAGKVIGGKVVVDGLALAEGETVTVVTRETESVVQLSVDEETALLQAIAEAGRGETLSPDELFARLRRSR